MKKLSPNYHKYNVFCVTRKYEANKINKVMHGLFIPIKLKGYSKSYSMINKNRLHIYTNLEYYNL